MDPGKRLVRPDYKPNMTCSGCKSSKVNGRRKDEGE